MMGVSAWLRDAQQRLEAAGIVTARLDALVLLEDALGVDRARLLAHPDMEISEETQNVLTGWVERRTQHEPLAYIRSKAEFYGREFIVSDSVLVPRPESEAMIELLKVRVHEILKHLSKQDETHQDDRGLLIADVGAGSGCLGITAQLELPGASVELLDIDKKALAVAKENVIKLTTGIPVLKSDLLSASKRAYDVLLCNLPYVPDEFPVNDAARHEPKIALFAGADGLDLYRKLFLQIAEREFKPLLILTEALPEQHEALKQLASTHGYAQTSQEDFIQAFEPAS